MRRHGQVDAGAAPPWRRTASAIPAASSAGISRVHVPPPRTRRCGGRTRSPAHARDGRDHHDHRRVRRRRAVRGVGLVGPELRRQGLHAGRDQHQRRGQLGDRGQEHQAERGDDAGRDHRQRDPDEHRQPAAAERAAHLGQPRRGLHGRGPHADQGQREEQQRVGEDRAAAGLVQREGVADGEEHQAERDDDAGHRLDQVGAALQRWRSPPAARRGQQRHRHGGHGGQHRRGRRVPDGRDGRRSSVVLAGSVVCCDWVSQ